MDEPQPPAEVPSDLAARLQDLDADTLYTIASYVEALADARTEPDDRDDEETDGGEPVLDDQGDEFPEDVPSKASLVQKEINDNRYWYYQWREGDAVTSEYKGPVDSKD